ncbi:hypothetical protein [Alteromonas sediminis]|nr:hypothetical protein [Alteromonas sediminis]
MFTSEIVSDADNVNDCQTECKSRVISNSKTIANVAILIVNGA